MNTQIFILISVVLVFLFFIGLGYFLWIMERRARFGQAMAIFNKLQLKPLLKGNNKHETEWYEGLYNGYRFYTQSRLYRYRGSRVAPVFRIVFEVKGKYQEDLYIGRGSRYGYTRVTFSGVSRSLLESFEKAFPYKDGAQHLSSEVNNALFSFVRTHCGGLFLNNRAKIKADQIPELILNDSSLVLIHDINHSDLKEVNIEACLESLCKLSQTIEDK
ncbi:hypothetical protein ACFL35_01280 [Candidatus Riflebacteria bacterium]